MYSYTSFSLLFYTYLLIYRKKKNTKIPTYSFSAVHKQNPRRHNDFHRYVYFSSLCLLFPVDNSLCTLFPCRNHAISILLDSSFITRYTFFISSTLSPLFLTYFFLICLLRSRPSLSPCVVTAHNMKRSIFLYKGTIAGLAVKMANLDKQRASERRSLIVGLLVCSSFGCLIALSLFLSL